MRTVIASLFLYICWAALIAVAVTAEGHWLGVDARYGEASLVEYLESSFLLLVAILFYIGSRVSGHWRGLCIALTFAAAVAAVREQDSFFDHNVFDGAWQLVAAALLVWAASILWRYPGSLADEASSFANSRGAGLLMAGFVTVFVFSRIVGMQTFWRNVMGDRYLRVVKNIVEEGIELFGYSLLVLAAAETVLHLKRLARQPADMNGVR